MKIVKMILPVLFFLIAISAIAEEAKPVITAAEVVFCTGIEERQPVGANSQFFSSLERVFCFTRITGAAGETKIYHVWYFGEDKKAKVELNVGSSNWRTWSSKRIADKCSGAWRVDIVLEDGQVIGSREFIYKPSIED
ncbi:MAG: DUF2914 domain-containing protein [Candidatus Krumholzibacteriota bacterium]|nr:DUF2914 domain-containing protein [Candidatus Krumholzibacteriota bacterium]